jgi:hypothetical protein
MKRWPLVAIGTIERSSVRSAAKVNEVASRKGTVMQNYLRWEEALGRRYEVKKQPQ